MSVPVAPPGPVSFVTRRGRGRQGAALLTLALGLALLAPARAALAQDGFGGALDYVEVKVWLDRDAYHAGDTARIAVEFRIDSTVHVNSHVPTLDYLFPTDMLWDAAPAGIVLGDNAWPKAKMQAFEFTDGEKIAVLEGRQIVRLTAKLPATLAPGSQVLTGTFQAQGCTHSTCYAPQKDKVKVTLRVVPAGEETQEANETKFAAGGGPAGDTTAVAAAGTHGDAGGPGAGDEGAALPPDGASAPLDDSAAAPGDSAGGEAAATVAAAVAAGPTQPGRASLSPDAEPMGALDCAIAAGTKLSEKPLLLVFLGAFLAGLGLTLTPCVLPLVPVTVGFFARQNTSGKRPLGMATLYVLGLALVYSSLGTVAALTGGLFGSLLQSPIVLVGIALLLVALALSMFGLWNMELPSSISSRIGGGRAGHLGALGMGAAMGLVAAPCVGPFVVSLLTYVADLGARLPRLQAVAMGGGLFFVLALGLGVPFFLVGMGVATVRPGEWMVSVKKFFGFLILGTALWFVKPLFGSAPVFEVGLIVLLAACAWFFLGPGSRNSTGLQRSVLRGLGGACGVATLVGAVVLVRLFTAEGGAHASFRDFSEQHLTVARTEARPVVIDFTADWCAACKELELRTFPAPEVLKRLDEFVALRADMSEGDDPTVKALGDRFTIVGLPTIVFLDASGAELKDLRLSGFEPAAAFAERLDCARASRERSGG